MTWPTAAVSTANLDNAADSAALARADLLQAVQNLNLMRAWIGADEVPMAAAATVDIGGQTSNRIALASGSGAITSLGVNYGGGPVFVRVAVPCSLTHHATTLVIPAGVNLTLRAGDFFMAVPKASGGASDGWLILPAAWTGPLGLNGGVPDAYSTLVLGRTDTASEGGQLDLCRSSDNAKAWALDVYFNSGDVQHILRFIDRIAGVTRMLIDGNGNVGINPAGSLTSPLDVNGDRLRLRVQKTPASATAAGNAGEWCNDASYFYVCTATNTWKRTALATW